MTAMSDLGNDPRPSLVLPRELIPLPLAIGLGAIMAIGLLIYLLANRQPAEAADLASEIAAQRTPPELAVPSAPEQQVGQPFYASEITLAPEQPAAFPDRLPLPSAEEGYPPVRFDEQPPQRNIEERGERDTPGAGADGMPIAIDLSRGRGGSSDRERSQAEREDGIERTERDSEAVRATQIRNRVSTIPQGAIIAAVLETPLNSDRPGLARAIISQDVRGFDGSRILIPRGSRLIGEFKAEAGPGLRRVPVIWTRLIRPDGMAIRIASPGADPLGGAGIGGRVDTHFAQRLFDAVLQSALTVGVNVLSNSATSGGNPVYVGLPGQAQQVGEQLVSKTDRPPTVKVRAGAEISVLVARDLDFSGTPAVR